MTRSRSPIPAYIYLAAGLASAVVFMLLPPSWQNQAFDVIALSGVAAILIGTWRNRPQRAVAWYLMALGQFLFVAGDIVWTIYEVVLERDATFPSFADVAYLGGYLPLGAGLLFVVGSRRPGRNISSLIDAAIITVAAAVASWIFLMAPQTGLTDVSTTGTVVSLAYPMADVLLIAVAASLAFNARGEELAYWLIGASLVALIAADALYIPATLNETYQTGNPIDIGWILSYVLWGVAALHPSMRALTQPSATADPPKFTRRRLITEGLAVLTLPVMWSIQTVRGEPRFSAIVVFALTLSSFLIIGRMAALLTTMEKAALHDPLTGLPNRRLMLDRIDQAFKRAARSGQPVAVLFLDLTGFKSVNDQFGHEAGDNALVAISRRIETSIRTSDTVARLGGDEFVIVCEGLDRVQAEVLVERIRANVASPLEVLGKWVVISVDLGIAVESEPAEGDVAELLASADRAMYRAKAATRSAG